MNFSSLPQLHVSHFIILNTWSKTLILGCFASSTIIMLSGNIQKNAFNINRTTTNDSEEQSARKSNINEIIVISYAQLSKSVRFVSIHIRGVITATLVSPDDLTHYWDIESQIFKQVNSIILLIKIIKLRKHNQACQPRIK